MFAAEKLKKFCGRNRRNFRQVTSLYLLNKRKLELYGAPTRDRDALLALLNKNFIEIAAARPGVGRSARSRATVCWLR